MSRRASTTLRKRLQLRHRLLRPHAAGRPAPSLHHPDGHHRHACRHRPALHRRSQGLLPRAGHRRHPRHQRSAANYQLRHHGAAPAEARRHRAPGSAVDNVSSFIGVDGTNTTLNSGRIQINLKPLDERKISATDVIRRLQPKVADVDGIQLFLQPLQDLTVEDRVSRTQFQYSLEDPNAAELATYTRKMVQELSKESIVTDVASDLQDQGLGAQLVIDRDTAARLGIAMADIDNTLYDAFGQRQVSTIFTQLNQYHVVMEVGENFQTDPSTLNNLYVKSANGTQVPLSTIAHWQQSRAQLAIGHQGQFPSTVISFNLAPG